MNTDAVFSADDVSKSNLEYLSRMNQRIAEERMLELADIAESIALESAELFDGGYTVTDVLSLIGAESKENAGELHPSLSDSLSVLRSQLFLTENLDKAVFSSLLLRELSRRFGELSEGDFLPQSDREESFTYLRNSFSDEAYDVFSQDFADPRVSYADTLADCVRAVSEGRVSYCLLPLEDRGGTRLPAIAELILKNDLKINSVTPVFGLDGNADLKYALLSESFTLPKREDSDDVYLELRLLRHSAEALASLLSAAVHFGHSVYRINTLTLSTEEGSELIYSLVLRDTGAGFTELLAYLTLFFPDFVIVGIYKNLE